jgi:NIMA (never in mitosis gene a)-related kinase
MEESKGPSIEQFETVRQLGSGSFGEVRLVRRLSDSSVFALKSVSLTRLTQKERESALNEIRLLASFSIPTVIKYEGSFFDYHTQELCVLMEYADGGDLQVTLRVRSRR